MEGKREGGAEREIPLRKASLVEILGIDNYGIYMSFFFCLFYIYIFGPGARFRCRKVWSEIRFVNGSVAGDVPNIAHCLL